MTTPTISNVSGTVGTGNTLTISGANLYDPDTTDWDLTKAESEFNGASFGAMNWSADGSPTLETSGGLIGSKMHHWNPSGARVFPAQHVGRVWKTDASIDGPIYMRGCFKFDTSTDGDGSWPDTYHKLIAHYSYSTGDTNWVNLDATDAGGSKPTRLIVLDDSSNYPSSAVTIIENQWHIVEVKFPWGADLNLKVWWDNVLVFDDDVNDSSDDNASSIEIHENQGDTGAGYDAHYYTDGLVISASRVYSPAVVEIGNSSDYATATKVYQPLESIESDSTEIQVNCDVDGITPTHLWVTNGQNQRSIAYDLSGGANVAPSAGSILFTGYAPDLPGQPLTVSPTPVAISFTGHEPVVSVSASGGQVVFFTEGFEDDSWSSRGWYDGDDPSVDSVVYSPNGGSAALKLSWGEGETSPDSPRRKKFDASESVYMKFDMKLGTSGTTWQGSGETYHPHFIHLLTDSEEDDYAGLADNYLTFYFEPHVFVPWILLQDGERIDQNNLGVDLLGGSAGHAIAGGNGNQTQAGVDETDYYDFGGGDYTNAHVWKSAASDFSNDTWHTVEVYVVMNSVDSTPNADGIIRCWVDGNLVIDKTNVYLRTAQYSDQKFNQFVLAPYIGDGSPIAQDAWIDNLVVANMPEPGGIDMIAMRARNDDGSQATATWIQAQDVTAVTASDKNVRIRASIDNSSGSTTNYKYRLEYKLLSDSTWTPVGTGAVQIAASENISNGGETSTPQLTTPPNRTTNDFVAGKVWDDENGETSVTLNDNKYTELEWCVTFDSGETNPNENYQFRVTRS